MMKINANLVDKIVGKCEAQGLSIKQIEATGRKIIVQAYCDDNDMRYYIEIFYNRNGKITYYRKWANEYLNKGEENEIC